MYTNCSLKSSIASACLPALGGGGDLEQEKARIKWAFFVLINKFLNMV